MLRLYYLVETEMRVDDNVPKEGFQEFQNP